MRTWKRLVGFMRRILYGRSAAGGASGDGLDIAKGNEAHRNPYQRDLRGGGSPGGTY